MACEQEGEWIELEHDAILRAAATANNTGNWWLGKKLVDEWNELRELRGRVRDLEEVVCYLTRQLERAQGVY